MALEYNNCASLPRVSRLIQEIQNKREAVETMRLVLEKQCSIFGAGPLNSSAVTYPSDSRIRAVGCATNQSLNFFMMDADQYQSFSANLGFSKKQFQLNPNAVFIVDPKVSWTWSQVFKSESFHN